MIRPKDGEPPGVAGGPIPGPDPVAAPPDEAPGAIADIEPPGGPFPESHTRGGDSIDREQLVDHLNTIFSVSSGMVGVCLTGIGLVKVVTHSARLDTICDELIVLDATLFSLTALLSYRALHGLLRGRPRGTERVVDSVFFLSLCLMVVICGVFAWSVI